MLAQCVLGLAGSRSFGRRSRHRAGLGLAVGRVIERLEARTLLAADITVIAGAAGSGTLDHFLGTSNGTITVADDPGDTAATLSTGALQAVGATVPISVAADDTIHFDDIGTLNLQTGPGTQAAFQTSGTIDFSNTSNTITAAGSSLSFSAGGDLTVANLNSQGGNINLAIGAGHTFTAASTAADAISSTGGNITISTDNMALNGGIDAGTSGIVTLEQGSTTTRNIDLGGGTTAGDLNLSDTELGQITAGVLRIGRTDNPGGITVTAPVTTHAGFNTLHLFADGVGQSGTGAITVANLAITAADGAALAINPNHVTDLAADITLADRAFVWSNGTNALSIASGGVDGVVGVTADEISLGADTMNLDAAVNAGTGLVTLDGASSGRGIALGTKPTGSLGLTNADLDNITAGNLRIGDLNRMSSGVTVTAPITAPSTLNTLELLSNLGAATISQNSGASITATNLVAVAPYGVFLTDPGNTVVNLGGTVASFSSFDFVNSTSLNVANVDARVKGDGIQSAGSPINITALGSSSLLTVEAPITTTALFGGSANITLSADDMAINAAVNGGTTGVVTLEQGDTNTRDIDLGGGTLVGDLDLSDAELGEVTASVLRIGRKDNIGTINVSAPVTAPSGVGILHLITGGAVAQSNNGALDVPNLAISTVTVVKLANNINDVSNLAAHISGAGNFLALKNGANTLTVASGALDGVLGVTINDSAISLLADSMNIDAPVNAGTGSVTLEPFTSARPIILGSKPSGSLGLTNAELDDITTSRLLIGDLNGNVEFIPITITAPITAPSSWSTLELFSGTGTIRQNSGASITVRNLAATASQGVFLSDPGNTVTNLGGEVTTFASFNFVNSTSFNVANVDPGADANGIQSEGSPISLTALGSGSQLSVNAPIFALGFSAMLNNITLTADEISLNNTVSCDFPGAVILEQGSTKARDIDLGGGTTAGDLGLSDAELGHVIASVLHIGRADNAGNIIVIAPITTHSGFDTLSLVSGGAVDDANSSTGDVTVANLIAQAADGINLDTAVSNLAFENAAGAVSIRNTGGLTIASIGSVDGVFSSSSNLGATTTLSATGQVTFAANTTSAGTLSATTIETEPGTPFPPPEDNITIDGGVTVQSTGGDVDLQAADAINATGRVLTPSGSINLSCGDGDNDNDGSMSLNGTLSASGNIALNVPAGDSATLTGSATASEVIKNGNGSFFVDRPSGSINSGVMVDAGTLGGTGSVTGAVALALPATLAPGHNAPGILTTGTETLSAGSTFSVQLAGPTPGNTSSSYGQLDVNGNVNLNGATLVAALSFAPGSMQSFTLIQAIGNISGEFAQGDTIVLNGITYGIAYLSHSVVLTRAADLSVSIAGPISAVEGSTPSYIYTVSNLGPAPAQDVVFAAAVPVGAVFVSASFGGAFIALPASDYDPTTGMVSLGTISARVSGTLMLTVKFPEEAPGVAFNALVTTSSPDPNPSNNTFSLTTRVNDAPLTAQGKTVSAAPGTHFNNVIVATFTDANLAALGSDFTATINWGDGMVSAAQIVSNDNGTFSVIGSHKYANAKTKSYALAIKIVDVGGSTATATGTAQLP
jgi:fibronectin-binding autotransporter adhesin